MPRTITFCADDYGISPSVDEGIISAVECGSVTAVSCMVIFPEWHESASRLREFQGKIDIGLHLTLTQGSGDLSPGLCPYPVFLKNALLFRLDEEVIFQEFDRQCRLFEASLGFLPDFVDSHHHVHQLPRVSGALLRLCRTFSHPFYCRNTAMTFAQVTSARYGAFERLMINIPGRWMRSLLLERGIATNHAFFGMVGHGPAVRDRMVSIIRNEMRLVPSDYWIFMVHPGYSDVLLASRDSGSGRREEELEVLTSRWFTDLLVEEQITPCRFRQ